MLSASNGNCITALRKNLVHSRKVHSEYSWVTYSSRVEEFEFNMIALIEVRALLRQSSINSFQDTCIPCDSSYFFVIDNMIDHCLLVWGGGFKLFLAL